MHLLYILNYSRDDIQTMFSDLITKVLRVPSVCLYLVASPVIQIKGKKKKHLIHGTMCVCVSHEMVFRKAMMIMMMMIMEPPALPTCEETIPWNSCSMTLHVTIAKDGRLTHFGSCHLSGRETHCCRHFYFAVNMSRRLEILVCFCKSSSVD